MRCLLLPMDYLSLIQIFAPYFSNLRLAARASLAARRDPGAGPPHRHGRAADHGAERASGSFETYHRVLNRAAWSSWALSRDVAEVCWSRRLCRRGRSCVGWTTRLNAGGGQDQSQRHLSRPGALQPRSLRESQWPALVELDAVGADPVGAAHVGVAVPDLPGAVGTLL